MLVVLALWEKAFRLAIKWRAISQTFFILSYKFHSNHLYSGDYLLYVRGKKKERKLEENWFRPI